MVINKDNFKIGLAPLSAIPLFNQLILSPQGLFYEFDGRQYCEYCFQQLYAPCCRQCGEYIIGKDSCSLLHHYCANFTVITVNLSVYWKICSSTTSRKMDEFQNVMLKLEESEQPESIKGHLF